MKKIFNRWKIKDFFINKYVEVIVKEWDKSINIFIYLDVNTQQTSTDKLTPPPIPFPSTNFLNDAYIFYIFIFNIAVMESIK